MLEKIVKIKFTSEKIKKFSTHKIEEISEFEL
jgi:hypothetical protein